MNARGSTSVDYLGIVVVVAIVMAVLVAVRPVVVDRAAPVQPIRPIVRLLDLLRDAPSPPPRPRRPRPHRPRPRPARRPPVIVEVPTWLSSATARQRPPERHGPPRARLTRSWFECSPSIARRTVTSTGAAMESGRELPSVCRRCDVSPERCYREGPVGFAASTACCTPLSASATPATGPKE